MDRRSFFGAAVSALGLLGLSGLFRENVFAAGAAKAVKAKAGGKSGNVFATEESLKGLEKANGLTEANFWGEGDKVATVQNFCNAAIPGNKTCGDKRQANQFCGSCQFIQNRVNYDGNVA